MKVKVFYEYEVNGEYNIFTEFPKDALKNDNWYHLTAMIGINNEESFIISKREMNFECATLLKDGKYADAVRSIALNRKFRFERSVEAYNKLRKLCAE